MIWSKAELIDIFLTSFSILIFVFNIIYFQVVLIKNNKIKNTFWKKITLYFLNIILIIIVLFLVLYLFFSCFSIKNSWFMNYFIKYIIVLVLIIIILIQWIIKIIKIPN